MPRRPSPTPSAPEPPAPPTPRPRHFENRRTMRSVEAVQAFNDALRRFMREVEVDGLAVRTGPIFLGTPSSPSVQAPIDMDPQELAHRLEGIEHAVFEIIERARKAVSTTREALDELGLDNASAEERMKALSSIAEAADQILHEPGRLWHPRKILELRRMIETSTRPGRPEIEISVTVTYVI